ncbi:SbcD-like subunit of palindrome specific endonuclease [Prochlorococcus phage P-TIM68]|uniref:Putative recombination endonuclease subunit n=1 Tax=Prochlorococcus phage P-TIM68 TaxID=1542477 RepID=A0A0K0KVH8_9CAUD|nr:SbcD-like subunit of palindrome specific endonuclease [Prochlorococcus phage P-TIM68]AIR93455.1 putative recombination endonuclease subunit [Prochlorococcus phage P-TIM68]
MKIAIITDQHFGCRKNSKLFHDYFLRFYEDVFFPTLEKEGITTIVDMGDTFDSRKGIDFCALTWAKENYYNRLQKMGIEIHSIVGNHTAYYKNTNDINAINLLLREYANVKIYSETTPIEIDNLSILLVPWINPENEKKTMAMIEQSRSPVVMGHLELHGFKVNDYVVMEHGTNTDPFAKFDRVYSGHFHTRSSQNNIHYLGSPYEMYWNDWNDTRGFHLFDTETLEHTPINNPYNIFEKVFYEDTPFQTFDTRGFEDKIVKVIVRKKSDIGQFERFIDKIYSANVAELKIVENFDFSGWYDTSETGYESEDTLSILNRYIDDSEVSLDKSIITKMVDEIYREACEVV